MSAKPVERTLLEQMRISEFEIEHRKSLFSLDETDIAALLACKGAIDANIDCLVSQFYKTQTNIEEIALLIGDSDTLGRLRHAQRRYILDLFSGIYDLEYVHNRLRIGLVHKRIGVEPKLYLSAVYLLKTLLQEVIEEALEEPGDRRTALLALDKLLMFDVTLVFDTYIRSLVSEIELAKEKAEQYAQSLEEKVQQRTQQLHELSCTDPLTGLLNMRHLIETLTKVIRAAQRRAEPVSVIYIDVNDFKTINDSHGHQRGDEVLQTVATAIKEVSRMEDSCFRYGGDEFCIVLPNCREEQARDTYMIRLKEQISQHLDVTLSIGIAQTGPNEYLDAVALIRQADEEMYAAKKFFKASKSSLDQPCSAALSNSYMG